ncbi:hypothetical protein IR083_20935 [Dysgonomonas sp. GY75]|uniref:hypothetical protein n=1 Tax=Dysgonomonas sp. GY75 TaxID=2780419 RepID=UPI001883E39D|nr:hypothetical protein [Dysgonomonas sp. GY75]MBF0651288.1 hypothetical protein [Dysgonomonas sp. GY75]
MIIDASYFHGEIVIPFLKSSATVTGVDAILQSVTNQSINDFICQYESRFLKKLLGQELRDAFLAGLEDEIPNEIWIRLKNLLLDTKCKTSPIAYYVYYFFKCNESTITTGLGEVMPTQSEGTGVDASRKMVNTCRKLRESVNEFYRVFDATNYILYYGNGIGKKSKLWWNKEFNINIWNV